MICDYPKGFNELQQLIPQVLSPLEIHDVHNSARFLLKTKHVNEKPCVPANLKSAKALLYRFNFLNLIFFLYLSSLVIKTRCIQKRHRISRDFQSKMPAMPKLPFLKFMSHGFIIKRTERSSVQFWNKYFVEYSTEQTPESHAKVSILPHK